MYMSTSTEPLQEPILLSCPKCDYRAYLSECENSRRGMSREERIRLLKAAFKCPNCLDEGKVQVLGAE